MGISLAASGSWTEFTGTTASPSIPGSPATGDRMYVWLIWKNQSVTGPASLSGWNKVAEFKDGTVNSGNGTGSVTISCWYRDWQSGDTAPTFTMSGSVGVGVHIMQLWSKGAGEAWDTPTFATAAMAAGSAIAAEASAAIAVPDGSVVMNAIGVRDDSAAITRTSTSVGGWAELFSDNFNRTDSATSPGPGWTNRRSGSSNVGVKSNQAYHANTGAASASAATIDTTLTSDDGRIVGTLAATGAQEHGLFLAVSSTGTALEYVITASPHIRTATNWDQSQTNRTVSGSAVAGDKYSLDRIGSLITARQNFVSQGTFDDTTPVQPRNSSHRLCGIGFYHSSAHDLGRWDDVHMDTPVVWNGNYVENPSAHFSTTTGNDMAADLGHRFVTTGGSATWLNTEATLSASETAATVWVAQSVSASGTTGTAANTLQKALFSGSGAHKQTGTVVAALQKATAALSGYLKPTGTVVATAQAATFSGSATHKQTGTVVATAQAATFSGLAIHKQTGTIAAALPYATAALSGYLKPTGTIAAALPYATAAMSGSALEPTTGTIAATSQPAIAAAAGHMQPSGTLAGVCRSILFAGTGGQAITGAVVATTQMATAAFSAVMQPSGTLSATAQYATATAAGIHRHTGTVAASLTAANAALSGYMKPSGTVATTAQSATFAAVASQVQSGLLAATLPAVMGALAGYMKPSGALGSVLQAATLSGTAEQVQQGIVAASIQAATLTAAGTHEQSGVISAIARMAVAALAGSAQQPNNTMTAFLQPATAALTGTQRITGTLTAAAVPVTFLASATHEQAGSLSATLRALTGALTGTQTGTGALVGAAVPAVFTGAGAPGGPVGSLNSTLRHALVIFSGAQSQSGDLSSTLSPATLTSSAIQQQTGLLAVTLSPALANLRDDAVRQGTIVSFLRPATFFSMRPTPGSRIFIPQQIRTLVVATQGRGLAVAAPAPRVFVPGA